MHTQLTHKHHNVYYSNFPCATALADPDAQHHERFAAIKINQPIAV
jgi:hypothetical protein